MPARYTCRVIANFSVTRTYQPHIINHPNGKTTVFPAPPPTVITYVKNQTVSFGKKTLAMKFLADNPQHVHYVGKV